MRRSRNFRRPTDDASHTAVENGEAALMELCHHVADQMTVLAQQLVQHGEVLHELPARLAQSSRNSRKPPASEGYGTVKRTASVRQSGDKPHGGQPGHDGQTLLAVEHPAHTLTPAVPSCAPCQASVQGIAVVGYAERQGCARPALRIAVPAHRAEITVWPACGHRSTGSCPEAVTQAVPSGSTVQTWAASFPTHPHMPVERTTESCADLVPHRVSAATVLKAAEAFAAVREPATEAVKKR
jgi:transposase